MRVTPNRDVLCCHVCVTPHRDVPPYACYTGQTLFPEAHLLRLYRDVRCVGTMFLFRQHWSTTFPDETCLVWRPTRYAPHIHTPRLFFSGNKTTQFFQSKTATLISKTRRNAASRRALLDTQAVVTCAPCVCCSKHIFQVTHLRIQSVPLKLKCSLLENKAAQARLWSL
jgi:hypothetical protein